MGCGCLCLAFTPDSRYVVSGYQSSKMRVWRADDGKKATYGRISGDDVYIKSGDAFVKVEDSAPEWLGDLGPQHVSAASYAASWSHSNR